MWIRYLFLLFCTFAAGISVAGAYAAFIALIGILPALLRHEHLFVKTQDMSKLVYGMEGITILGIWVGNVLYLFSPTLPLEEFGLSIFTFFGGMFTGCLAGALEETLQVFPIISRRTGLRHGMPYILMAAALGRCVGSLILFYQLQ